MEYQFKKRFVNIKVDVIQRYELNLIKARNQCKNLSSTIKMLINISKIKYTVEKNSIEQQVDGLRLADKIKDGWKIKKIDYSILAKEDS